MKITEGDWIYWNPDEWTHCIVTEHGELPSGEPNTWAVMSMNSRREDADANARFVIDSQKVYKETGKTPRQLAEDNAKLRAALKRFLSYGNTFAYRAQDGNPYEQAVEALGDSD